MDSYMHDEHALSSCPYCEQSLIGTTQQEHLDECEVYETLMQTFNRNSVRSRLYTAMRNSMLEQSSEEELPGSIRYLQGAHDSVSVSSFSDLSSDRSRVSTPEFRPECMVYPLRPTSKRQRGSAGCPVCFNDYSLEAATPLVLPSCGHTVCAPCLKRIIAHNSVIKCPVCRQLNFKEVEHLPVNYALLEYSNLKETRQVCATHSLELVGYCETDDTLLCGACVFEHKDHDSFLLTDERAQAIAGRKRDALISSEKKLQALRTAWQKSICDVNAQLNEVNGSAEGHIRALKAAEKQMIAQIKEGAKACIGQVRELVRGHEVFSAQQMMSAKISSINAELGKLKQKRLTFDELSMVEKLRSEEFVDDGNEPPSVELGRKGAVDMKTMHDYKKAIKSKKCPISNI